MIHSGDQLYNASSGSRFMFLKTAKDTDGEYVRVKCSNDAGKDPCMSITHLHPLQSEDILVLAGKLGVIINGQQSVYCAGEKLIIPAGEPHKLWNASPADKLHIVTEMRPALQTERIYETVCALSQVERVNRVGTPRLLHLAVMLHHYQDHITLTGRFAAIKNFAIKLLAHIGRQKGYKASYRYRKWLPHKAILKDLETAHLY